MSISGPNIINQDTYINGEFSCLEFTPPAACIVNASVAPSADLDATKLIQQIDKTLDVNGNSTATAAAVTRVLHRVYGATGTLIYFAAGSIAPCTGNATITVDLRVNGTTALASVITLDNANVARVAEAATLVDVDVVTGDLLEVVATVNAGTGVLGTGVFVHLVARQEPL